MDDFVRMNLVVVNVLGRHTFFGWIDGYNFAERLLNCLGYFWAKFFSTTITTYVRLL